ncbi:B3 domain-containing protein [Rhynchospora pubera]|uniref:B3 domain-containing protein n=2 Tax=Rhynchospora pubera TaxID=906938 RepID=A0AAV8HWF1_9POAL|nr:B3 domain-containing protein [Rhynchospora pubera]
MWKRDCKKCSKWEKHFYWSHMDSTKISFFKKMDASCLNQMDLPKAFQKNFNGRIAKNIELQGPSGNIWQVVVTKLVEKLTFQSGWKDFVIANSIKVNDLLVFKYNTESAFEVQIFDPSGCERSSSYFVKEEKIDMHETSDSSIRFFDGPDCKMQQDETVMITSSSSSDSEYNTDYVPIQKPRGQTSKEAGTSKDPNGGNVFQTSNDEPLVFPKRLELTPAQKRRAIQLSHGVQPWNKCFVTLIKCSHMNGRSKITIPTEFSSEHLSREKLENKNAILHYKRHKWPMSICYYNGTNPCFSSGWKNFARDNNLQIGDLCLFELMKDENTVSFKVHISRN